MRRMGSHGRLESLPCRLSVVVAARPVGMDAHETRDDGHALGIDHLCTDDGEVAVGHFEDFAVADEH